MKPGTRFRVALASVLLISAPEALAQRGPGGGHGGMHGRHWMHELALTQDQMERMRDLRHRNMPQIIELRAELRSKQKELAELFAKGADAAKIQAKNTEIAEIRKKLADVASRNMAEMSKILTPEQRSRLARQMEQENEPAPETQPFPFSPSPTPRPPSASPSR